MWIVIAATAAIGTFRTASAQPAPDDFATTFARLLAAGNSLEAVRGFREAFQKVEGDPSAGVQGGNRFRSDLQISPRAKELIVACEVSSQQVCEAKYLRPVWPGKLSGLTVGIGCDLGYQKAADIDGDWRHLVDDATWKLMRSVALKRGNDAKQAKCSVAAVSIPWATAMSQFDAYLPYAVGLIARTFKNCDELPADCLGALVSLVYSRGASLSKKSARRKEMRHIAAWIAEKEFALIPPGLIRWAALLPV